MIKCVNGPERHEQESKGLSGNSLTAQLLVLGNFPCCLDQGRQSPKRLRQLEEGVLKVPKKNHTEE